MKTIGENALGNTDLSTVTLPRGLETIEDYAFKDSEIAALIIPSLVTSIGMMSLPSNDNTTIVLEGTTYSLLNDDKFADPVYLNYVSLLLPSVTENSIASGVKNSCAFEEIYMGIAFSPNVYYNWNGSGAYEDATDAEKLNIANYTSL